MTGDPTRLWVSLNVFGRPCRLIPMVRARLERANGGVSVSWLGAQVSAFWGRAAQGCAETCTPMGRRG